MIVERLDQQAVQTLLLLGLVVLTAVLTWWHRPRDGAFPWYEDITFAPRIKQAEARIGRLEAIIADLEEDRVPHGSE